MINWKILLPSFLLILFLVRYYDFFYVYQPIRLFSVKGDEPTLASFLMFNYFLQFLFYLFKIPVIAAVLSAGIFLGQNRQDEGIISFGQLMALSLSAEFIFLLQGVYKIVYFTFVEVNYSEHDYSNFFPLSLYDLFGAESLGVFAPLLKNLNLFELAYMAVLAFGLKKLKYQKWAKAAAVTLYSYGSLLLFWVLVLTYFSL